MLNIVKLILKGGVIISIKFVDIAGTIPFPNGKKVISVASCLFKSLAYLRESVDVLEEKLFDFCFS